MTEMNTLAGCCGIREWKGMNQDSCDRVLIPVEMIPADIYYKATEEGARPNAIILVTAYDKTGVGISAYRRYENIEGRRIPSVYKKRHSDTLDLLVTLGAVYELPEHDNDLHKESRLMPAYYMPDWTKLERYYNTHRKEYIQYSKDNGDYYGDPDYYTL